MFIKNLNINILLEDFTISNNIDKSVNDVFMFNTLMKIIYLTIINRL